MAVEQSGERKGGMANRRHLLSAAWIAEAVILGLGMFLPLIAVIVILLHQDIAADAVFSLGALAAAGLLSGALVLRRAVQRRCGCATATFACVDCSNTRPTACCFSMSPRTCACMPIPPRPTCSVCPRRKYRRRTLAP